MRRDRAAKKAEEIVRAYELVNEETAQLAARQKARAAAAKKKERILAGENEFLRSQIREMEERERQAFEFWGTLGLFGIPEFAPGGERVSNYLPDGVAAYVTWVPVVSYVDHDDVEWRLNVPEPLLAMLSFYVEAHPNKTMEQFAQYLSSAVVAKAWHDLLFVVGADPPRSPVSPEDEWWMVQAERANREWPRGATKDLRDHLEVLDVIADASEGRSSI